MNTHESSSLVHATWPCGRGRPRWWHRLRASIGGYFWVPCRVCGRPFGGHEIHGRGIAPAIPAPDGLWWIVCSPECEHAHYEHRS